MRDLSNFIIQTSRCGLGQAAPNPVLGALENFGDLYVGARRGAQAGAASRPSTCPRRSSTPSCGSAGSRNTFRGPGGKMNRVTLHDRREGNQGDPGADHPQGRRGRRDLHPPAVRLQGPHAPRQLPRLLGAGATGASRRPACRPSPRGWSSRTTPPEMMEYRRNIIDMLFVEGNHFCMFCEKSGICELQALAYRFGITAPQVPVPLPEARHRHVAPGRLPRPQPLHPLRPLRPGVPGHRPQERLPVRRARRQETAAGQRRCAGGNRPARRRTMRSSVLPGRRPDEEARRLRGPGRAAADTTTSPIGADIEIHREEK